MIFISIYLILWLSSQLTDPKPQATPVPAANEEVQQIAASPQQNEPAAHAAQSSPVQKATKGVLGSKHDFSLLTGRAADACGACHVPHIQATRPNSKEEEPFSLAFYRIGGQREVLVADKYMPGPTSLLCLSCHNGAAAPSTVASSHAILNMHRSGFEVGGFSTRDHPIGVEYPARRDGYKARGYVVASGIPLPGGRMECTSCHDPHNASGVGKMLVISNQRSALCLTCHEK